MIENNPHDQWQVETDSANKWAGDAGAAFEAWLEAYGPGKNSRLPLYATDLVDRRALGLPDKSPIHPLDGNVLLRSAPTLEGVTVPTAFISSGFGTVFTLHIEDFGVPSINYNYCGSPKLWVVIPADQYQRLKTALRTDRLADPSKKKCHQYIRHEQLFLHPAYLRKNNIRHTCFLQPAGHVVLVLPGSAHYGLNLGTNIAEANNYVPAGWTVPRARQCDCYDWQPIQHANMIAPAQDPQSPAATATAAEPAALAAAADPSTDIAAASASVTNPAPLVAGTKRPASPAPANDNGKRRKESPDEEEAAPKRPADDAPVEQWIAHMGAMEPRIVAAMPEEVRNSHLLRHVLALCSRACVVRTCQAMRHWRNSATAKQLVANMNAGPEEERIRKLDLASHKLMSHRHLSNVMAKIVNVCLERAIRER